MAKIIGNTTATPNPRPDWNQTDASKADYIKNKPDVSNGFKASVSGGSAIILEDVSPITHEISCQLQLKEGETATYEGVQVYCTGYNIWDEQWEIGTISTTGELADSTNIIRSKNFIRIIPNFEYAVVHPYIKTVFYYDEDMSFISSKGRISSSITTPDSACYMKFVTKSNYGTTYNNNICICTYNIGIGYRPYQGISAATSDSEGFVSGLTSYGPYATIFTDNKFNLTNCRYNKDINKIIDQTFDPNSNNAQSGTAVAEAVDGVIGNAPTNLNTLSKIANAIDNNPSFSKNVSNALKNTASGIGTIEITDASPIDHRVTVYTGEDCDVEDHVVNSESCCKNEDGTISIDFDGGTGSYLDIVYIDDLAQNDATYGLVINTSDVDGSECEYSYIDVCSGNGSVGILDSIHTGDKDEYIVFKVTDNLCNIRLFVVGKISLSVKFSLACIDGYSLYVAHDDGSVEMLTPQESYTGKLTASFNTTSSNFKIVSDKQIKISCEYNIDINTKMAQLENASGGTIDQEYNPDSENAQSGKAVKEAVDAVAADVGALEANFGSALDEIIELQEYLINGGDTAMLEDAEGVGF